MVDPFQGLLQGYQAAQQIQQAPQLNQLNMLQQQAKLEQLQGLDPLTQQKISEIQTREAGLTHEQELQSLELLSKYGHLIKQVPENLRGPLTEMVSGFGVPVGDISDVELDALSSMYEAQLSSDPKTKKLSLDIQRLLFQKSKAQSDIEQKELDRKLKEKQLELAQQTEERQSSKLSATAEKALIESQDNYTKNTSDARSYELLASDFIRLNPQGGAVASFDEAVAKILGSQDEVNELRRRFNKIRINEGLKNLPPGPATDKDVQLALQGVPPSGASVQQVVSFLKGASKAATVAAKYEEFKSNYISDKGNTRGLLNAWKEEAKNITFEDEPEVKEGDIISNAEGKRMQLQNGEWVEI